MKLVPAGGRQEFAKGTVERLVGLLRFNGMSTSRSSAAFESTALQLPNWIHRA